MTDGKHILRRTRFGHMSHVRPRDHHSSHIPVQGASIEHASCTAKSALPLSGQTEKLSWDETTSDEATGYACSRMEVGEQRREGGGQQNLDWRVAYGCEGA